MRALDPRHRLPPRMCPLAPTNRNALQKVNYCAQKECVLVPAEERSLEGSQKLG